ncbi:Txe/YoeB family addiction module toxin [Lactococcus laudensis]|uniref:Endoribonuclease YoeB n=1 Tax=Pseudolactococcus laudensis TaxID=1494461 RepID=A0A7V8SJ45_9LACT|nr:Txe/YoeB family addiction module toxin [Lactococcus laudensis]MBA0015972.1 Txe/YoeB family addiction module toxin [Lactococcus laudensis]MBQ6144682.1 Txe/YoeB family addiction module toxin [Lactococcus sp.]MBW9282221.1 Txe/YoeB family addiction module toxin [Lactococcus laudensis]
MIKSWSDEAWDDYLYWQREDKKTLKRINLLVKDIDRTPYTGIGKPEPLKYNLTNCWSRRITGEHRLVYQISDNGMEILQCRYHY